MKPRICVVVLCGLPGAGKSTIVKTITEICGENPHKMNVHIFDFDALGIIPNEKDLEQDNVASTWKSMRTSAIDSMDVLLAQLIVADSSQSDHLHCIYVDDNMFYRGMRLQCCKLAKKYNVGYMQVFVNTDVEQCVQRDMSRCTPVGESVIWKMHGRFQQPSPNIYKWEKYTIVVNGEMLDAKTMQDIMDMAMLAADDPMTMPAEVDIKEIEQNRVITNSNEIHQADLSIRKIINEIMCKSKPWLTSAEMRLLSEQLRLQREIVLAKLKNGAILDNASDMASERDAKKMVLLTETDNNEALLQYKALHMFKELSDCILHEEYGFDIV